MKVLKAPDVFGHKKIEIAYSLETKLNKLIIFHLSWNQQKTVGF